MSSRPTKQDLRNMITDAGVENVLLFDIDGDLIESSDFEYDGNYAAMSGMIATMCKEIIQDLEYGDMDKITIHADHGLVVVNKFSKDYYLASFSKDGSKLGLIMKTMDSIINK
ncbi:hypothetical protein [Flavobacterium sp. J27]|uniref:roadblock/LC7 domain-containing protein n=1 Tax=Flavobacterium sp. J27 TaxID=2060419 RepID=UPI001030ED3D|nr:hypothetical protein [Flavobacterium sp. J27]